MNKSYINLDDELEDKLPYDSISSRDPLEAIGIDAATMGDDQEIESDDGSIPSPMPAQDTPAPAPMSQSEQVRNAILKKKQNDLSSDPLMATFNDSQKNMQELIQAKRGADYIGNMGQAFAQMAQGANTPKPATDLFKGMATQNEDMVKNSEKQLDAKQKIIQAIEQRKSREGVAAEARATREAIGKNTAAIRQGAQDTKTSEAQNKAYTSMRHDLETFRGNQAAQQAALKVLNADTALAIVKNKDPNTLTTQDLHLLAEEMGKVASGGVPTESGVKALLPNTLATKVAEMKSFLSNNPSDANAAKFIQHNMQYLEEMKNVANSTLSSYRSNIAKGYKSRVRPEDYEEATRDYSLGGSPIVSAEVEAKMGGNTPVRVQAPDGKVRLVPQDKVDAAIAAGGKRL